MMQEIIIIIIRDLIDCSGFSEFKRFLIRILLNIM